MYFSTAVLKMVLAHCLALSKAKKLSTELLYYTGCSITHI